MLKPTKIKCPICKGHYSRVDQSEDVCENHQDWLVTVCDICHNTVFSDCAGICYSCFPDAHRVETGKHDPRWTLRADGMESENDYFGRHG